jgi:hypothetical protein
MLDLYLPSDSALLLRHSMVFQKTVVIQPVVSMGWVEQLQYVRIHTKAIL